MSLTAYLHQLPRDVVEEYNWKQAKVFLIGFVVGETFLLALFSALTRI